MSPWAWVARLGGGLVVVGLVAFVVMASGVVRMRASAGHWGITEALLQFASTRSVATNSMGIEVPELDDRAWSGLAATHYELWCATCHGRPGDWDTAVTAEMLPPPARLGRLRDERRIFYVVKHGLKFTGMPGWPAQARDDEVWVMVSLLRQVGGMTGDTYRELVERDPRPTEAPDVVVTVCAGCHGLDGEARHGGVVPRLAGQHETYLEASLEAYAALERASGFMAPAADRVSPADRQRAAAWYAGRPIEPGSPERLEPDLIERGRRVARSGVPEDRVPPCAQCHGPRELADVPVNPRYPRLDGQPSTYLRTQLDLFRRGARGGTEYHTLMDVAAGHELDDEAMAAVAAYYASL